MKRFYSIKFIWPDSVYYITPKGFNINNRGLHHGKNDWLIQQQNALNEMEENARRMGANAVVAVDLDYETIGASGSMLMVTAAGTAVILEA